MLQQIKQLDVRTQRWADVTQACAQDVQQADVGFVPTYSLEPGYTVEMYRTVGSDWSQNRTVQIEQLAKMASCRSTSWAAPRHSSM